jgi:hypothetical protein
MPTGCIFFIAEDIFFTFRRWLMMPAFDTLSLLISSIDAALSAALFQRLTPRRQLTLSQALPPLRGLFRRCHFALFSMFFAFTPFAARSFFFDAF